MSLQWCTKVRVRLFKEESSSATSWCWYYARGGKTQGDHCCHKIKGTKGEKMPSFDSAVRGADE